MGFGCNRCGNCSKRFWLESPECLLNSFDLVPRDNMTLEERMNTITRLVIVVFIILLVMKHKHALTFLIISLVIIIIVYYAQRKDEQNSIMVESGYIPTGYERFKVEAGRDDQTVQNNKNPRRPNFRNVPEDLEVKASRNRHVRRDNRRYPRNLAERKTTRDERPDFSDYDHSPHPRRPYPAIVPEDLKVKTQKFAEPNYITLVGRPRIVEEVTAPNNCNGKCQSCNGRCNNQSQGVEQYPKETKLNANEPDHWHKDFDSTTNPSGYDLYINRMKKLENQFKARERTNKQSHINSIF